MSLNEFKVPVLDKGYVQLITWTHHDMVELSKAIRDGNLELAQSLLGQDDLSIVNAAKASYNRSSKTYGSDESRLMNFLGRAGHPAPLRHAHITFEVKAPLMVARQWYKYRIGSTHNVDSVEAFDISDFAYYLVGDDDPSSPDGARNEASRRYIKGYEWYVPEEWRSQPKNKKQGSGPPLPEELQVEISKRFLESLEVGKSLMEEIEQLLQDFGGDGLGVAPEQLRGILPCMYNLYTSWRWTASLDSVLHFLRQRQANHAQEEIRKYAEAVRILVEKCFPGALESFGQYNEIGVVEGLLKLLEETAPELCVKGAATKEVRKARTLLHHLK